MSRLSEMVQNKEQELMFESEYDAAPSYDTAWYKIEVFHVRQQRLLGELVLKPSQAHTILQTRMDTFPKK